MVGNIILSFSTLASAFRLKAPLPPYLPPVEKSRQRLVDCHAFYPGFPWADGMIPIGRCYSETRCCQESWRERLTPASLFCLCSCHERCDPRTWVAGANLAKRVRGDRSNIRRIRGFIHGPGGETADYQLRRLICLACAFTLHFILSLSFMARLKYYKDAIWMQTKSYFHVTNRVELKRWWGNNWVTTWTNLPFLPTCRRHGDEWG